MVGNSIIVELAAGDRVQVYMYTFTGLHDKPGNRLTQFMGCLLRPLDQLSSNSTSQVMITTKFSFKDNILKLRTINIKIKDTYVLLIFFTKQQNSDGSNNLSSLVVPQSPRGQRMALSSERF